MKEVRHSYKVMVLGLLSYYYIKVLSQSALTN